MNIGVIAVALVDLRLAQIMGARLDWDLLSLALGEGPKMMWRMAQPYLPVAAALLVGIVVIYTCALLGRAIEPAATRFICHRAFQPRIRFCSLCAARSGGAMGAS